MFFFWLISWCWDSWWIQSPFFPSISIMISNYARELLTPDGHYIAVILYLMLYWSTSVFFHFLSFTLSQQTVYMDDSAPQITWISRLSSLAGAAAARGEGRHLFHLLRLAGCAVLQWMYGQCWKWAFLELEKCGKQYEPWETNLCSLMIIVYSGLYYIFVYWGW